MPKEKSVKANADERVKKIREALQDRTLSRVSEVTGLHVNTIRNIAKVSDQSFSISTVNKLYAYLFPAGA